MIQSHSCYRYTNPQKDQGVPIRRLVEPRSAKITKRLARFPEHSDDRPGQPSSSGGALPLFYRVGVKEEGVVKVSPIRDAVIRIFIEIQASPGVT